MSYREPKQPLDPYTLRWVADLLDNCVDVRLGKILETGGKPTTAAKLAIHRTAITDVHVYATRAERDARAAEEDK